MQVEPPLAPHAPDVPEQLDARRLEGAALRGERFEEILVDGGDLSGPAHDLRLDRVRLRNVGLSGVAARGLRLSDGVVTDGDWSNADLQSSALDRIEASGLRATGASFSESDLTDVVFESCRLDLASFRLARLTRVVFRDCRLEDADFYGANLTSVSFEDSSLPRASFDAAAFERSEIRSCDLTDLGGVERLTGVRIGVSELMQIAAQLANAHGIAVVGQGEEAPGRSS